MSRDLTEIPFDHYQRYAAAASLVRALGASVGTVLEIGANRQRLLGEFLPGQRLVYTDLEPQENMDDFVVADACALPFAPKSHDVVVSLDVLEHIAPESRPQAVAEMARVAARMVVIGCPLDRPWVHEAEREANAVWRRYFDCAYPWLEEHEEHGLVDAAQVEATLRSGGLQVIRFGQGDCRLWASLMGAHFVKEAVAEFSAVVAAVDRYYNQRLFAGDRGETSYREFFVGLRHAQDVEAVRVAAVLAGQGDAAGSALLSSLGRALLPVTDRVREAELQWHRTADMLAGTEARLQQEALAHHQTGLELQELAASAEARLQQEALAHHQTGLKLQEMVGSAEARLQQEALAHHQTGLQLQQMALSAVEQLHRADAADLKVVALDAEMRQAQQRMDAAEQLRIELVEKLAQGEARLATAEQQLSGSRAQVEALGQDCKRLTAERDALAAHVQRLSQRTKGLERRQRWAVVAAACAAIGAAAFLMWQ